MKASADRSGMRLIGRAFSVVLVMAVLASCGSAEPEAAPSPKADTIAVVLGHDIPKEDADRLDGIIFGALREKFVADNRITATDAEVDGFIVKFNQLQESLPMPIPSDGVPEADMRAAEREVAQGMVTSFKINQAFYEQYGGRVIFQQFGPEPVDAYRDFLKEQEREGNFEILDKQYEDEFWDYFVNDSSHSFLSAEEGAEAMTTPWWLRETDL